MSSPHLRLPHPAPLLGGALGLVTAATLAVPGALAAPLTAETTTPAPTGSSAAATSGAGSASGSATGSASGSATGSATGKDEGYRYWGFYQYTDGKWAYAQTTPYQVVPKDGSVDGWRYAAMSQTDNRPPRATPSFDDICGKYAGEAGKKRVGVVIDYGRKADTANDTNPPAAIARCALVPTGASSAEVLNAVAGPREEKGMVCAIDNWPGGSGCAEPVATLSDAAKAPDDKIDISVSAPREQPKPSDAQSTQQADQGPSKKLLTGVAVAVVALAGAAAWLLSRRRRRPVTAERGSEPVAGPVREGERVERVERADHRDDGPANPTGGGGATAV